MEQWGKILPVESQKGEKCKEFSGMMDGHSVHEQMEVSCQRDRKYVRKRNAKAQC